MDTDKPIKIKKISRLWCLWKLWFPGADWKNMYVAFGRTIYTPKGELPPDMWIHESTHLEQQEFSYPMALLWHLQYRFLGEWRYTQEIEAYRNQLRWFESQPNHSYREKYQYRKQIAEVLAGPMYGLKITKAQAFEDLGSS